VAPLRTISGGNTSLYGPLRVAIDTIDDKLVVSVGGNSILVFARAASGDVAPLQMISG